MYLQSFTTTLISCSQVITIACSLLTVSAELKFAELLKNSAPSRIVNLSSAANRMASIDLDNLRCEKKVSSFHMYATSKLANLLFTRELARRLEGTGQCCCVFRDCSLLYHYFYLSIVLFLLFMNLSFFLSLFFQAHHCGSVNKKKHAFVLYIALIHPVHQKSIITNQ